MDVWPDFTDAINEIRRDFLVNWVFYTIICGKGLSGTKFFVPYIESGRNSWEVLAI